MLLRESGAQHNQDFDLGSVTDAYLEPGVESGTHLRALTEATIRGDWVGLAQIREAAATIMGEQQAVDTLVVAAAFNGITRVADATGIPLDDATAEQTDQMRQTTGIAQFEYSEKTQRYG